MNNKIKTYKTISYLGAFVYVLLGFLTIGSIINGTIGLYINLIVGVIFIIIGYYFYAKAKSFMILIDNVKKSNNETQATLNAIAKFLFFEKVLIITGLLFGVILLSAAISRVFGEKLPIFG